MNDPLHGYLPPEAREAETRRLAARAGGEVVAFGASAEGRPLLAARLPASAGRGAPRVLCAANLHGLELVGTSVALGLLEALGGGAFGALRAAAEVWVAPSLNPDGHARTFERAGEGPVHELRTNARGVDLNRNFPLPLGALPSRRPFAGSGRPGAATYRGPSPLSEPESRALDALLARERFHAVLSLHSFMGALLPARVLDRRDAATYRTLCAAFSAAQRAIRYRRLRWGPLDTFTGELEDHAHHAHGAWSACVEIFPVLHSMRQHPRAPNAFWRFNPRRPAIYVENDLPGVVAFLLAALRLPHRGTAGPATPPGQAHEGRREVTSPLPRAPRPPPGRPGGR
jgi:predicted deacylase